MACIIPFLFSCIEILSSDIIRANIAKARNWLVYAYNQQQDTYIKYRFHIIPEDEVFGRIYYSSCIVEGVIHKNHCYKNDDLNNRNWLKGCSKTT